MKQSGLKTRSLSIVPPAKETVDSPLPSGGLRDAFDGWLNSVSPAVLQIETLKDEPPPESYRRRSLTSRDVVLVNRATVRESDDHRHWPPEIVEKFLAADVITRKKSGPTVL